MAPPLSRALTGAAFMVLASAIVAATTLMAKALGQGLGAAPLHPLQVSAGRFCFAFLALTPFVLVRRPSFRGAPWPLHAGRSLAGWAGVSCLFAAAAAMPLADATAISFTNPIVAMMLAIPLLGERVGPWRWGAAAIALAGGVIIIGPGTEAFRPVALIAAAAALFIGLEAVLIKRLSGREPPLRILYINNGIGSAIALSAAAFVWLPPTAGQWVLLMLLGTIMAAAQACFIQAMKRADASFVMPFSYATLVFAGAYDIAVFGDLPTVQGMIGALLVATGAMVLAWRERSGPAKASPATVR